MEMDQQHSNGLPAPEANGNHAGPSVHDVRFVTLLASF
jgi:hypothetical protein